MLCECLLGALAEVEVASAGACAVGPAAAASPARCVGVGVVVAVVSGGHFVVVFAVVSVIVYLFSGRGSGWMRFVMVDVEESYFILFASVWGAVGVAPRTRGGWCRGVAGIRNVFSLGVFGMSVVIAVYFIGTGVLFTGEVSSNLNFR